MTLSERPIVNLQHRNGLIFLMDLCMSVFASTLTILFVRWQTSALPNFMHYFLIWIIAAFVASCAAFLIFKTHKVVIWHSSFRSTGKLIHAIIDMCLSFILLIIFSPLFLIRYIAIKIGDKGPAIFSQERIGRFGKPFTIYKFRSMRLDAEKDGPAMKFDF